MVYSEVQCPFCAYPTIVEHKENEVLFQHPPIIKTRSIYDRILKLYRLNEISCSCFSCSQVFSITKLPSDEFNRRKSKELDYYLKIGLGIEPDFEKQLFIEKFFQLLKNNSKEWIFIFSALFIMSVTFSIIPQISTNTSSSLISMNWIFFIYFPLSFLLIYFSRKYLLKLRELLNLTSLNFFISNNYKMNNWSKCFEEWQIRSRILDYPYGKITESAKVGLMFVCFYLFFKSIYIWSLFHPPFTNSIICIFSCNFSISYLVLSELLSLPLGIIIAYILGSISFISLMTIDHIYLLIRDSEFDHSLIDDDLDSNNFFKIWIYSIGIQGLIFLMFALILYWATGGSFSSPNSPKDYLSQILGFASMLALILYTLYILFSPIYHLKLKINMMVTNCQRELKKQLISFETFDSVNSGQILQYIKVRDELSRLRALNEWQLIFGKNQYKNFLLILSFITSTGLLGIVIQKVFLTPTG
jgi:hypothetical protein